MERVEASVSSEVRVQPHNLTQAVKAVCALLGSVETLEITCALEAFYNACSLLSRNSQVLDVKFGSLNNWIVHL